MECHTLPFTGAGGDAPIFFPTQGALALSETLLGLAPITTPLQWLGVGPVATYNVVFLLSCFRPLAARALAWQLTRSHGAALVAGVAYGFNPYRTAQIPHLQTLVSCWMPWRFRCTGIWIDTGAAIWRCSPRPGCSTG